jgi:succinate-acetate transporter protein
MAEAVKQGNPAVVGLAGFGLTTLILHFITWDMWEWGRFSHWALFLAAWRK